MAERRPDLRWIIVAAEPITDVDTTAADMLEELDAWLNERGVSLVFAELKDPVREKIERYELTRTDRPRPLLPHPRRRRRPGTRLRPTTVSQGGRTGPTDKPDRHRDRGRPGTGLPYRPADGLGGSAADTNDEIVTVSAPSSVPDLSEN